MLGWAYYKTITISDSNVDADLADFPLLVAFDADSDIGEHARADGHDLRFTLDDGETELSFERESFSIASGQASGRFWVKAPSILATGGAVIRCYYGNPFAADASDPESVWTNDFASVFHFRAGDPANEYDAVDTSRKLTPVNTPAWSASGPNGAACYSFGNSAKRCFYASGWLPALTGDMTLEMFGKFPAADIANWRYAHFLGTGNDYQTIATATTQRLRGVVRTPATAELSAYGAVSADTWYHLALTVEDASRHDLFIDGAWANSNGATRGSLPDADRYILAANNTSGNNAMDGSLAEVRVSTVIRSDAWIKFTEANLAHAGNELSWGSEVAPDVAQADVGARRRYEAVVEARARYLAMVRSKS